MNRATVSHVCHEGGGACVGSPDSSCTPRYTKTNPRRRLGVAPSQADAPFLAFVHTVCNIYTLGFSKIKYVAKIMKLFTRACPRAVARHSAPRAPPGGAECTELAVTRDFRPFKLKIAAQRARKGDRWKQAWT